jgi:hypothetical protein
MCACLCVCVDRLFYFFFFFCCLFYRLVCLLCVCVRWLVLFCFIFCATVDLSFILCDGMERCISAIFERFFYTVNGKRDLKNTRKKNKTEIMMCLFFINRILKLFDKSITANIKGLNASLS